MESVGHIMIYSNMDLQVGDAVILPTKTRLRYIWKAPEIRSPRVRVSASTAISR